MDRMEEHRTPLHDILAARGAVFGERFPGFPLPRHFGDPMAEHRRARATASVFDISPRGKIEVRGPDRVKFMQGMISNDLKALAPGQGFHACALTPKSKIIAHFRLHVLDDRLLLDTTRPAGAALLEHLRRFRIMAKCEFDDATDRLAEVAIEGPRSPDVVAAALGGPPPDLPRHGIARVPLASGVGGGEGLLVRYAVSGEDGYRLYVEPARAAAVATALLDAAAALGGGPAGLEAMETLRVENGQPQFGRDFDENTMPQEAGLDDALSLNKGCFMGYEPVARIHFRGHVNRKIAGLALELPETPDAPLPPPGTPLLDDQEKDAGHITSTVRAPSLDLKPIALAMVRREKLEPGTRLKLGKEPAPGALGAGVVTALPFFRPAAAI